MRRGGIGAGFGLALALVCACTVEEGQGGAAAGPPVQAATGSGLIAYEVTPVLSGERAELQVDLTFRGDADGRTELILPDAWASEKELYRAVSSLELVEGGALLAASRPGRRVIRHKPGARVHVRYALTQDYEGEPALGKGYRPGYRAVVRPDYAHFIGHVGLALPRFRGGGIDTRREVEFRWRNLPEGWQAATSWGDGPEGFRRQLSERELRAAVYVAGDFRIETRERGGATVRVALRGKGWGFSHGAFADRVMDIFDASRTFWRDAELDSWLVTIIPVAPPRGERPGFVSISGTGLTRSFAIFSTQNANPSRMDYVLTHEMQHEWITRRMGVLAAPEERLYWFSEGFADFYAYRLMVRAGLMSVPAYVTAINGVIDEYYASPAATLTGEAAAAAYWSDGAANRLPYLRGHLMALSWDALIRERTKGAQGLDNAVRGLIDAARAAKATPQLTEARLLAAVDALAQGRAAADHARYQAAGEKLNLSPGLLGPCAEFSHAEVTEDGAAVPRFATPEPFTAEKEAACRKWLEGPPPEPEAGSEVASGGAP